MTLALAALAVGPSLWVGLATPDCAPVDQGACPFGQAIALTFALWFGVVIGVPLTVASAILWLTRKKYLPEIGDECATMAGSSWWKVMSGCAPRTRSQGRMVGPEEMPAALSAYLRGVDTPL